MRRNRQPVGVHLVGSIPTDSAEEAFHLAMQHLGGLLKRLPDGEVGERDTWIRWQHQKIGRSPQIYETKLPPLYVPMSPYAVLKEITSDDQIEFPNLGYADAAIESFAVFEKLRSNGIIPDGMRFQVGLPTPLSVAIFYVEPTSRLLFEGGYKRAIEHELMRMLRRIPPEKLSIQWETVSEFALLEGVMDNHLTGNLLDNITNRLANLVDLVPTETEVGLHLCYGDSGHKHFCEPKNADYLGRVASGAITKAQKNISWIHMPVPRERDDLDYFTPLANFDLAESTDLYLGLVHHTDGKEATLRRIETAKRIVPRFGVATECGLGRRDLKSIPDLMRQHAEIADEIW